VDKGEEQTCPAWLKSIKMRDMRPADHLRVTGGALKNWFIAQTKDSAAVAVLWLIGLLALGVPGAPLWALFAFFLQYVPNLGPVLTLVAPMVAQSIEGLFGGDWMKLIYILILYAVIAAVDGFFLQPYLMKRAAKVPVWASIITPIVMGMLMGFWGVLLSAPLLAIVYAYRRRGQAVRIRSAGNNR
jgi:predicted PurR-regulated permease PerM